MRERGALVLPNRIMDEPLNLFLVESNVKMQCDCDCSINSAACIFIMLYKVVLTFESVDKILKCDHSNESY